MQKSCLKKSDCTLQGFNMNGSPMLPKCLGIPVSDFDPSNPEHRYVRLYVGLEEADHLIKDLDQALDKSIII